MDNELNFFQKGFCYSKIIKMDPVSNNVIVLIILYIRKLLYSFLLKIFVYSYIL